MQLMFDVGGMCKADRPAALRENVYRQYNRPTAYDASCLALAESAGCELWPTDSRLVKAVAGPQPCCSHTRLPIAP